MKLYRKIVLALCVVVATSCALETPPDPNPPSHNLPSTILIAVQKNLAGLVNLASNTGGALTRQINSGGSLYNTAIKPEGFDALWASAYASVLLDADQLMKVSIPNKGKPLERYARHMGITRIVQAYALMMLVDMFGDVPFSQAFQGDANFNPDVDSQESLYNKAIILLDSAKLDLTTPLTTSNPPGYQSPLAPDVFDLYYGNGTDGATTSFTRWLRLANTLKLKAYLSMRMIDPAGATAGITALISDASATGGLIGYTVDHALNSSGQTENFMFRYGTSAAPPDSRHPNFAAQYPAGGGAYQANWFMWHMFHGYDATHRAGADPGDPRMRFYFYRQVLENSTDVNEIACFGHARPSHYPHSTGTDIIDNPTAGRPPMGVGPSMPTNDPTDPAWSRTFCFPTDRGYWGRDHIDPQEVDPDGALRTAYGAYPTGGRFDNSSGVPVTVNAGMRGAGIQPMMMRSFVSFMLSEAALYLSLGGPAMTADAYYTNGLNQSFTDVHDWAVNGTHGTTTVAGATNEGVTINAFYPAATYANDVALYVASAVAAFNASSSPDAKMNYCAREFWIALYGNGIESYNLYRRTGMPSGMQPALTAAPGDFPRSYWYPATFALYNTTVDQKPDLTVRVFWDGNGTNLNF